MLFLHHGLAFTKTKKQNKTKQSKAKKKSKKKQTQNNIIQTDCTKMDGRHNCSSSYQ